MKQILNRTSVVAAVAATGLVLAACSAQPNTAASPAASGAAGEPIAIVASTNAYGSIAQAVGGDAVKVTSIITNSGQDPHSYETTPQDQLNVNSAAIVIENGAGYDPFVDKLVEGATAKPTVINAVEVSGLQPAEGGQGGGSSAPADDHAGESEDAHAGESPEEHAAEGHVEGFNEHVFYSLPTAEKVAAKIAEELGKKDASRAATFTANAQAFSQKVDAIEAKAATIGGGTTKVVSTEPVAGWLLTEGKADDVTPEAFAEALEEGNDVPPAVLKETLDLVKTVTYVVYNEQTGSPEGDQVVEAARAANKPVVPVTETLPDGTDYLGWMDGNVTRLAEANGK